MGAAREAEPLPVKCGFWDGFQHGRATRLAELNPKPWITPLLGFDGQTVPADTTGHAGLDDGPSQADNTRGDQSATIRELRETIEDLREHSGALAIVVDAQARKISELETLDTQQRLRIAELEAALISAPGEADAIAAVLRLAGVPSLKVPSVKKLIYDRYHTDKHPKAGDAELAQLTAAMQKINAAFEILAREDRDRSPFH
jgi:hypothetical protein